MKESRGVQIMNQMLICAGLLVVPYVYYFLVRPKLMTFEKSVDSKIVSINDKDFQTIKSKMENLKKEKDVKIGANEENNKL